MSITFTIEQEKRAVYWWTKTLTPIMQNKLFVKYNTIFQYLSLSDLTIQDITMIHIEEARFMETPKKQIDRMFRSYTN